MMKKVIKILFIALCTFTLIINVSASTSKTTLKDLRERVASDQAKLNKVNKQQEEVKKKIVALESELDEVFKEINDCNLKIDESKEKVTELETTIENKQLEIDNLLNFLEISNGENVYLEYIFKAKSFTDFIYRASVVEQLTKYNDDLIDEMYSLIDENKQTQEKLAKKIEESEDLTDKLNATLKKSNLSMDDLFEDHKDAAADLKASKAELSAYEKLYKQYGCKETDSIIDCVNVPYADGFTRPVTSGSITSEYGNRYHPTKHYYTMHQGVDIGVPMNTKVYASAAGIVSKIEKVKYPNKKNSSCGGNKVYVKHRYNGKEYTTVYMHLHSISVKLNEYVTLSTVIGKSGGGESYDWCTTGPHLHFGIMKGSNYVNPRNYVSFPKKGVRFSSRWS